MYLDIELTPQELARLSKGGFISLCLKDGVRITVTRDTDYKNNIYKEEDYTDERK